jgi:hypothetical protein
MLPLQVLQVLRVHQRPLRSAQERFCLQHLHHHLQNLQRQER